MFALRRWSWKVTAPAGAAPGVYHATITLRYASGGQNGQVTQDLPLLLGVTPKVRENMARSDGITVPFTFNAPQFTSGTGALNISGQDSYPLFATDCGNPTRHFGNPPTLTVAHGDRLDAVCAVV